MSNKTLELTFLPPDEIKLAKNENGFLIFTLSGKDKGRVRLSRSYPFTQPDELISVTNLEGDEFGIIRDLKELNESSRDAAGSELKNRYFCPVIDEIKSIKERMGHFYFDVSIASHERSFTVRDISRNVRLTGENTVLVFDMDGNRYVIEDFSKIEGKSRRLLEPYLY